MFATFFSLLYVPLLLTNAVAILNEERFLAKSAYLWCRRAWRAGKLASWRAARLLSRSLDVLTLTPVGLSTRGSPAANSGFGAEPSYNAAYGANDRTVSMKSKAIGLISSVRTLMRREYNRTVEHKVGGRGRAEIR
jgi:hypothetical protein